MKLIQRSLDGKYYDVRFFRGQLIMLHEVLDKLPTEGLADEALDLRSEIFKILYPKFDDWKAECQEKWDKEDAQKAERKRNE